MRTTRLLIPALLAGTCLLSPARSHAGNERSLLHGRDAALTAGAVTATGSDGASLWYNPAGLVNSDHSTFSLSVTAFELHMQRYPAAMHIVSDGEERAEDFNAQDFFSVPASVTHRWVVADRIGIGVGAFVTSHQEGSYVSDVSFAAPDRVRSQEHVQLDHFRELTVVGAGASLRVSPRLRVGLSLFGYHDAVEESSSALIAQTRPDGSGASLRLTDSLKADGFGGLFELGVQGEAAKHLSFGLTLRSPRLRMFGFATTRQEDLAAIVQETAGAAPTSPVGALAASVIDGDVGPHDARFASAPKLIAGLAWQTEDWSVAADVEVTAGIPLSSVAPSAHQWQWNASLGLRGHVSDHVEIGGGFFTDRGSNVVPERLLDFDIDYYGATLSALLSTPLGQLDERGVPTVMFQTTLGLRYAMGFGRGASLDLDLDGFADDLAYAADVRSVSDLRPHELGILLATGVEY